MLADPVGDRADLAALLSPASPARLDCDVLVNCSGLAGAAGIFGDDSVYPIRGQVSYIFKKYEYGLSYGQLVWSADKRDQSFFGTALLAPSLAMTPSTTAGRGNARRHASHSESVLRACLPCDAAGGDGSFALHK